MFLFKVKRLIWSALEINFFELYFLQPVLGGHPVLSDHLAIPRGWPPNTTSTVLFCNQIKSEREEAKKKGSETGNAKYGRLETWTPVPPAYSAKIYRYVTVL